MSALVQISDPHFGAERPAVVDALVRLVAEQAPELVVMSGDITQRATPRQFAAARAFVDRLAAPVLAIPGNHDIPLFALGTRLFAPYRRYRAVFGRDLEPVHRSADWCVVGVRTTRRWRHSNGQVSAAQVDAVTAHLEAADPGQLRVVVVHQPIAVRDDADDDDASTLLRGHAGAVERWAAAGADLVVGGHIHVPYVVALHARRPGLERRLWCVQAGTAVSTRVRHDVPNSVNVIRRDAGDGGARRARVEQWDYDVPQRRFALARTWPLALGDVARG